MYHEKQYLWHCAVHTLNNLFQEQWATTPMMEDIAKELFDRDRIMRQEAGMGAGWINPYKSVVPKVGFYDVNVLLEALKLKDCHVSVHAVFNPKDPQGVARSIGKLDSCSGGVRGIIVNRVTMSLLGGLFTSYHYYAIIPWRKGTRPGSMPIQDCEETDGIKTDATDKVSPQRLTDGDDILWYVVDSKASEPEPIGDTAELELHLGMEARKHQAHVFVVSDRKSDKKGEAGTGSSSSANAERVCA